MTKSSFEFLLSSLVIALTFFLHFSPFWLVANTAQASYCPPGDKVCRNGNYWVCSSDGGSYQKKECCGDGCKKETPKPQDDKKPGDNGTGDPNNQVIPPGANCPPGHRVCGSKGIYWYCQGGESYQETNPPQCCGSGCNTSGGASSNTNQCDQEGLWACANGKVMICRQKQWKTVDNNAAVCVDNSSTSCQAGQVKCDGKNMQKCVCNGNNCAWQVNKDQLCTKNPKIEYAEKIVINAVEGEPCAVANVTQCKNNKLYFCDNNNIWQKKSDASCSIKDCTKQNCEFSCNPGQVLCDEKSQFLYMCNEGKFSKTGTQCNQSSLYITYPGIPKQGDSCNNGQVVCHDGDAYYCHDRKLQRTNNKCKSVSKMQDGPNSGDKCDNNIKDVFCDSNGGYWQCGDNDQGWVKYDKLSCAQPIENCNNGVSTCINGKAHKCENNYWKPIKENGKDVICADPNASECKLGQSKCDNGVMKNCVCQGNNCSFQPYSTNNGTNKCVTSINQAGGNNSGGSNNSGNNSGGSAGGSNNAGGGGGGTGGGTGIAPQNPTGYVDEVNGGACYITGWSCDANNPALPLQIDVYKTDLGPGNFVGATSTGLSRIDVAQAGRCNGNQNTGFLYQLPDQYKDGVQRTIHLRVLSTTVCKRMISSVILFP